MAAQNGDRTIAEQQYAALLSARSTILWTGVASVDRLLGRLAVTMESMDDAGTHFQEAMDFCQSAGYWAEYAWSAFDYADSLFRHGRAADRSRANRILDEAASMAHDLGMGPLADRAADLRDRIAARVTRAVSYPDGLSEREVEVLRLIAAGKTDREIGEELYISIRTVGTHVGNILNKIAAANRTEAAAYAARHELA